MNDLTITVQSETLTLMPECAIFWQRTCTLFIADTHFGRKPSDTISPDLQRLTLALKRTGATQLIILGDLIHKKKGYRNKVLRLFGEWRQQYADLKIILIRGNHDRAVGDPPPQWNITCTNGPTPGPLFVLQHEPYAPANPNAFVLAGHLHPTVLTQDGENNRCFWFHENMAVLPAFGSAAKIGRIFPDATDRVYLAQPDSVTHHAL
jgi:DNA ligase-associated metallophosphoesterase